MNTIIVTGYCHLPIHLSDHPAAQSRHHQERNMSESSTAARTGGDDTRGALACASRLDPSDVEEDVENKEDDLNGGLAGHRSMIMYMLSKIRIGMDLSRVALPAFILEKRSTLELYADFLTHSQLFAKIPDYPDPRLRMVNVVRYFLSTFHCARQTSIAKKPYNPILGEVFRCYWDLPDTQPTPQTAEQKRIVESGPVPFAKYDSITFFSEQVSHHPPVSGFYAEYPSKKMYLYGSMEIQSRFYGWYVRVNNIGNVTLVLMEHGEEYICTLPNAYARSILTYPWIELGGKCSVRCPQSGYHAEIDFHCKPMYGGRKNRVTAEIFHQSERKPFMKIDGEWNGVMSIKHSHSEEEVFVDTVHLPQLRRKIQKLSAQDPGESKRRWIKVTEALAKGDEQEAADAKHELEEKQRADARERQAKGEEWQQKHFHLQDDTWIYNNPLPQRLQATTPLPTHITDKHLTHV